MRRHHVTLLGVALLLGGCDAFGPDDVHVLLRTDAEFYAAPASVDIRLTNLSSGTIFHGVCFCLEQRIDGAWVSLEPDDPVPSCPAVLAFTEPHQQRSYGAYIEEPGEYRLRIPIAASDDLLDGAEFVSNAFTVGGGAE